MCGLFIAIYSIHLGRLGIMVNVGKYTIPWQIFGSSGYIGDYTTHLRGDYNKPGFNGK